MEIKQDILIKNYEQYKKSLYAYLGNEQGENVIKALGGENGLLHATFSNTDVSGLAYDGAFTLNVLKITAYAVKINEMLPPSKQVDKNSLVKVALLSNIARCVMFEENDNSWEKTNRGILYKYSEIEGSLRCGERSLLIAMSCGVTFTPTEFEAMRILDLKSDDNMANFHSSVLSMIIKHANEMVLTVNRIDG